MTPAIPAAVPALTSVHPRGCRTPRWVGRIRASGPPRRNRGCTNMTRAGADGTSAGTEGKPAPEAPTDLSKRSWKEVVKRTIREFKEDDLTLLAAALTYYGVLAIFPALLVLVSILGLLGASTTQPLIDNLASLTPGAARDVVTN